METRPPLKPFWMVPFTVHATRGILRDQLTRRATMAVCLVVVLVMVVCGLTLFRSWLDPHEHPVRFILYWLACAWQTTLVLLLALLDILVVRAQARAARKALRDDAKQEDA
jgi:biotin transporter BioY